MSLRDYFYYGLEFHDQPVNRLMGVVHTHHMGMCYSRVYEYDLDDLDTESEVPYELAKESIIEEIVADMVSYMDSEENYYIIDPQTHSMRIISLSKAESDNSGECVPEDDYDVDDDIEYLKESLEEHSESDYFNENELINLELDQDDLNYYFGGGPE